MPMGWITAACSVAGAAVASIGAVIGIAPVGVVAIGFTATAGGGVGAVVGGIAGGIADILINVSAT